LKQFDTKLCYGFFSALANPTRLYILEQLYQGPMTVKQLVEKLGQEQSMISHNLRPLTRCNLVRRIREGRTILYQVNKETLGPLLETVERHYKEFCGGECPRRAGR